VRVVSASIWPVRARSLLCINTSRRWRKRRLS
jgi:hypothetical protein